MAVDGLTHNAAPAPVPPKGACGRPLSACGHPVGRVAPRRPLTSGRHEHTEQLGDVGRKPPQEAFGRASRGRCEEEMRLDMRKPQPKHDRRARAAVSGGSPAVVTRVRSDVRARAAIRRPGCHRQPGPGSPPARVRRHAGSPPVHGPRRGKRLASRCLGSVRTRSNDAVVAGGRSSLGTPPATTTPNGGG
jgi:hypothetical protein